MPHISVVSKDEAVRNKMVLAIQAEGVDAIAASSLSELPTILQDVPTNGILIDLITSTKASAQEKQETNDLLQLYPHVKVKVIEDEIKIMGINGSLKEFINDCISFNPRVIRKYDRPIHHTGVYLSANSEFQGPEKAVTINISEGGCFVYTAKEWIVGERVWLHYKENDQKEPGVVCWVQPWGKNNKMPGIGINTLLDNHGLET